MCVLNLSKHNAKFGGSENHEVAATHSDSTAWHGFRWGPKGGEKGFLGKMFSKYTTDLGNREALVIYVAKQLRGQSSV
jgi:hypothetical protein